MMPTSNPIAAKTNGKRNRFRRGRAGVGWRLWATDCGDSYGFSFIFIAQSVGVFDPADEQPFFVVPSPSFIPAEAPYCHNDESSQKCSAKCTDRAKCRCIGTSLPDSSVIMKNPSS